MSLLDMLLAHGWIPDEWIRRGCRRALRRGLALARPVRRPESVAPAAAPSPAIPMALARAVFGARLMVTPGCYATPGTTPAEAEVAALSCVCDHAALRDGQTILELGCGWGALTLWVAQRYPHARITAVADSPEQRDHVAAEATRRGYGARVRAIVRRPGAFDAEPGWYDRVLVVERVLDEAEREAVFRRACGWLKPDGRLFLRTPVFKGEPMRLRAPAAPDWLAPYVAGPAQVAQWRAESPAGMECEEVREIDGTHAARTAEAWLAGLDAHREALTPVFAELYGRRAEARRHRTRAFLIGCAEFWRHDAGRLWPECHYRYKPKARTSRLNVEAAASAGPVARPERPAGEVFHRFPGKQPGTPGRV